MQQLIIYFSSCSADNERLRRLYTETLFKFTNQVGCYLLCAFIRWYVVLHITRLASAIFTYDIIEEQGSSFHGSSFNRCDDQLIAKCFCSLVLIFYFFCWKRGTSTRTCIIMGPQSVSTSVQGHCDVQECGVLIKYYYMIYVLCLVCCAYDC